jgi:hypothetical protein
MGRPIALLLLAAAQFVMLLDSSVMNVSISQTRGRSRHHVQGVQLATTAHTLIVALFMLVGAKPGDICGRDLRRTRHVVHAPSPGPIARARCRRRDDGGGPDDGKSQTASPSANVSSALGGHDSSGRRRPAGPSERRP